MVNPTKAILDETNGNIFKLAPQKEGYIICHTLSQEPKDKKLYLCLMGIGNWNRGFSCLILGIDYSSATRLPGFRFQLTYSVAMWNEASHLPSFYFSFLIWKIDKQNCED